MIIQIPMVSTLIRSTCFPVVIVNIRLLPAKSWIFITELFMIRLKSILVISVVIMYHIRIV